MTTVYLVRHSETFYDLKGEVKAHDALQLTNEKDILGVRGEKYAEKVAKESEFKNIDVVWASHFVRAMATAKYFAARNNTRVNIDARLGERWAGDVGSWGGRPKGYFEKQFYEEDYRYLQGESQRDVATRMREALFEIVKANLNKRILIVSHYTAITFLLKSLCDVTIGETIKQKTIKFNDKVIFEGDLGFCETFKLEFDDNLNLKSIVNIKNKKFK
ncbi:MAG: histidine phosphatase family protein [Clostridia bacterium]|nr:histidine phosphatase family protein [Clostridia bacterium]